MRVRFSYIGFALLAVAFAGSARASYIETFEDLTDLGGWRLTSDPNRPLFVQSTGGDPGAFLRGQVATPEPAWYVPVGTASPFLGDYAAMGVTGLGIDLEFLQSGSNVPNQALTLDLQSTLGTNDIHQLVEAYYIGPDTRSRRDGWYGYDYSVPAASTAIPVGWTVLRNGQPGTNADWVDLMSDVETLGFLVGEPGFLYPALGIWDLGLDNATITTGNEPTAPEPAAFILTAAGMGVLVAAAKAARIRAAAYHSARAWQATYDRSREARGSHYRSHG